MSGKNSQDGLTRTSRYLALVLRHKPQAAGITLDSHGWADVRQLLEGVNRTRHLTMEELEEIVRTDEKGRYAFNEDRTRIRANQGHSVPVDVELEYDGLISRQDLHLLKRLAVDGCTYAEAARELNTTAEACRKRAARAKQLLRKLLD